MTNDDDDFVSISTSVISQVTEVRLYGDTIEKVRSGHPEVPILLPSIQQAVKNAVANPTKVEKSYEGSYVFIDEGTTNKSGDPMQVPVKTVGDSTSARVRSVYFAENDATGDVIFERGSDE